MPPPRINTTREAAQRNFGMDPNVPRGMLYPYPKSHYAEEYPKYTDYTDWIMPEIVHGLARFASLPGLIASGGNPTLDDVVESALAGSGAKAITGGLLAPRGAIAMGAAKPRLKTRQKI